MRQGDHYVERATISPAVAILAIVCFFGAAATANPAKHEGTVVMVDGHQLTYKGIAQKGGGKPKEKVVKVEDRTKITLDGKEAKLEDLKRGYYLKITSDDGFALTIDATVNPPEK